MPVETIKHHVDALDGVRGIAVVAVVALHLSVLWGGFAGVDVFFVLSGFLITALLQEEFDRTCAINFKHFYIRRALRLLPALALCITGTLMYAAATSSLHQVILAAVFAITYMTNYAYAYGIISDSSLGHTWSLSVEVQFYLLWPPLLLLMSRHLTRTWIIVISTTLAIAAATWRMALISHYGESAVVLTYRALETKADALLIGGVTAMMVGEGVRLTSRSLFAICLTILLITFWNASNTWLWFQAFGFSIVDLAAAYLVGYLASSNDELAKTMLANPLLSYTGRISYGIYMYYVPIYFVIHDQSLRRERVATAILTVIAAALSFHLIEQPVLALGRRKQHMRTACT